MIEMTLEMAEKAMRGAMAKARELGTAMTVAVVDEAGRTVLIARGDGTGFFTPDTARLKAVAAAAFRKATRDLGTQVLQSAFWSSLTAAIPGQVLPTIGAVPLVISGRVIGAIGCGGGTGEQDHECAEAGARAIGSA